MFTHAATSTEMEGGATCGGIVTDIGKGLVHGSSKLGDGCRSRGKGKLVVLGTEELACGVIVAVHIVGRYYTMAVVDLSIHRVALPGRCLVGDLGDEQSFSGGIAVPTLLTDGLDEVE